MQKFLIFLVSFFGLMITAAANTIDDSETCLYNFIFDFNNHISSISDYYDSNNHDLNHFVDANSGKINIAYSLINEKEINNGVRINVKYTINCENQKDCKDGESNTGYFILKKGNDSFKVASTNIFDTYNSIKKDKREINTVTKVAIVLLIGVFVVVVTILTLLLNDKNYMKKAMSSME